MKKRKPTLGKRAVSGPGIRLVEIRLRRKWDGRCKDCGRGADGSQCVARNLIQVWCDCKKEKSMKVFAHKKKPKTVLRTAVTVEVEVVIEHTPYFGDEPLDRVVPKLLARLKKMAGVTSVKLKTLQKLPDGPPTQEPKARFATRSRKRDSKSRPKPRWSKPMFEGGFGGDGDA